MPFHCGRISISRASQRAVSMRTHVIAVSRRARHSRGIPAIVKDTQLHGALGWPRGRRNQDCRGSFSPRRMSRHRHRACLATTPATRYSEPFSTGQIDGGPCDLLSRDPVVTCTFRSSNSTMIHAFLLPFLCCSFVLVLTINPLLLHIK